MEAALTASIANDGQTATSAEIPFANGISTDTIAEDSANTGVTIDGVLIKDGALTVNEAGADVDTRIEGDTDVNLVYVDAGNDRVGIGTATPATKLDGNGALTATTASLTTSISLTSTDAGAGSGPTIALDRNSASPADNDFLGTMLFSGRDDGANSFNAAQIVVQALDVTNTTEDARIQFSTMQAGSLTGMLNFGAGVYTPSASGGDPGLDGINASDVQIAGVSLAVATQAEQETGTSTSLNDLVTPGRQHFHPSAAKAWVTYDHVNATVDASYGVSSVTDTGLGIATVNFSTAFSAATYCVAGSAVETSANNATTVHVQEAGKSTTACVIESLDGGGSLRDFDQLHVVFWGDL